MPSEKVKGHFESREATPVNGVGVTEAWFVADTKQTEPLGAHDVIQRLCRLSAEVYNTMPGAQSADCFCGEGGFWKNKGYGPTFNQGYRNDGEVLQFIEKTVRAALKSRTAKDKGVKRG